MTANSCEKGSFSPEIHKVEWPMFNLTFFNSWVMKIFHWTCFVFSFPRSFFPFVLPSEQLVSRNVGCFLSSSLPVYAAALLALCLSWHQGAGGFSAAAVLVTVSSVLFFFESHISHVYFVLFLYRVRGNVWHFTYLSWSLSVSCGSQQSHWEYGKRKVNLTGVYSLV